MIFEDGNQPATRADLKGAIGLLRTELKGDTQALRTELKDEIQSVRTELKDEIQSVRTELKGDIAKTQWQIRQSEERLRTEMQTGFREIRGTIDSFLGKLETYGKETIALPETLDQHGKILNNHEKRIKALESPL